jgi:hypothetical protein
VNEEQPAGVPRFATGIQDVPGDADSLRGALESGNETRRRRTFRTRLLAAAAVGIATVSVTVALLVAPARQAPSALATVLSALAETSAQSYSFSMSSVTPTVTHVTAPITVSGAYDPRRGLGTELLTTRKGTRSVWMQTRFIGKYVYTRPSPGSGFQGTEKPWDKAPRPPASANALPDIYAFATDEPVSPAALSVVLRSAGAVHDKGPASGPGWTGTTYTFTALLAGGRESVSGTVYVDQQGRARRLETITKRRRLTTYRDLTLTDFGAPVPATVPALSEVQDTSRPVWGYYF